MGNLVRELGEGPPTIGEGMPAVATERAQPPADGSSGDITSAGHPEASEPVEAAQQEQVAKP